MAGEVPAAGGAASIPSAGGAPPPAAPSPSGGGASGTGGGAAPVPAAPGGGGVGAPPASSGPRYLEREVTRDGKTVKERVKEEALWNAHAREAALNRKFEETTKRERELQLQAEQLQQREERWRKGSFRDLAKENKLDPIDALSRELEEALKEEQQNQDPRMRQLLEKSREADALRAELTGIRTREQKQQFEQEIQAELDKLSSEFVPALQLVKLPKNDITMRLMAEAKDTAQRHGLPLDTATLARETHKAAAGMVDGLVEGIEDDEELVDMFPKFSRRLHAGLLKRHKRLSDLNQAPRVPPTKPEDRKPVPSAEGPKLVRSLDEDKAYFGNRKVLRSGI